MSKNDLHLSWPQLAWGLATLAALLGGWYDLRSQVAQLRAEITIRTQMADKEHAQMWQVIRDAQANAPEPKSGR